MNTKQKAEAWLKVNGSAFITEAEYDAGRIITALLEDWEALFISIRTMDGYDWGEYEMNHCSFDNCPTYLKTDDVLKAIDLCEENQDVR